MKLVAKQKEIDCIKWDGDEATAQEIVEKFNLELKVLNIHIPYRLQVWMPNSDINVLVYGDIIGRDKDGDAFVIPKHIVELYFDVMEDEAPKAKTKKKKSE